MSLDVSPSKPYCSDDVVDVDVSAPGTSVLADEENSAADDEMMPPDQEALGMMLLLMKVVRPAHESSRLAGNLAANVVRVAPEWAIATHGAITVVSFTVEGQCRIGHQPKNAT